MVSPTRPGEWAARIEDAMATPPTPLQVITPRKLLNGMSGAALVICSDRQHYVVKGAQVGRPLIADQIVGRLGKKLGAPVGDVTLVDVPETLIKNPLSPAGTSTFSLMRFDPGIGHGTRLIERCADSDNVEHVEAGDNRQRFAFLAVLYGWCGASDRQYLYAEDAPRLVYSVDHGLFFHGGENWTIETLEIAPPPRPDATFTAHPLVDTYRVQLALNRLRGVTTNDIVQAVASPPAQWGFTIDERIAVASYLEVRRDVLLGVINGR